MNVQWSIELGSRDGHPFGAEYLYETIERLTGVAKVTDCTWHTLRHTFCTRLAMRGAPASTIQKLAGHSSPATTMRYMHVQHADRDRLARCGLIVDRLVGDRTLAGRDFQVQVAIAVERRADAERSGRREADDRCRRAQRKR